MYGFFLPVYLSNKYYDSKILFPMNSLFRLSIMCELWFHGLILMKVVDFLVCKLLVEIALKRAEESHTGPSNGV